MQSYSHTVIQPYTVFIHLLYTLALYTIFIHCLYTLSLDRSLYALSAPDPGGSVFTAGNGIVLACSKNSCFAQLPSTQCETQPKYLAAHLFE